MPSRILTICFCFTATLALSAQKGVDDSLTGDLDRYQKFRMTEVKELQREVKDNPRGVISRLNTMLNEFYLSDPSQRKIQQQQDVTLHEAYDYKVKREWNVNIQRLFMRNLLSKPIKGFLIKEAPNLYAMHATLAKAYQQDSQPYKAAYHLKQALRYRSLQLDPETYTDHFRLALLEDGDPQQVVARQYKSTKEELDKNKASLRKAAERQVVLEDNGRRQKEKQLVELRQQERKDQKTPADQREENRRRLAEMQAKNKKLLTDQIAENKALLDAQKKKNKELLDQFQTLQQQYTQQKKEYDRTSSKFLVETATLVRTIEDALKDRQKVINKKVLYKTTFNPLLHDYSQNRQFTAYANLLEMASRLDADDPNIPYDLGEEYRTSQSRERAILAYGRALEANVRAGEVIKLDKEKISHIYNSLGGLHYARNHFVHSASYYRKAMDSASDLAKKKNLTFQLAKIHTEKTGNFNQAEQLLLEFDKPLDGPLPTDPEERAERIKTRFKVWNFLSEVYSKTRSPTKLGQALRKAQELHEQLETEIANQRKAIATAYRELQTAKKPLLDETRDRELSEYYRKRSQYKREKTFLGSLESIRHSLPLKNIYFMLARHYEDLHNIDQAIATYRSAELRGIAPDAARRHVQRLKKR